MVFAPKNAYRDQENDSVSHWLIIGHDQHWRQMRDVYTRIRCSAPKLTRLRYAMYIVCKELCQPTFEEAE
jgi:hypothetical protein